MEIWCCGCNIKVEARLTNGGEIYPHRSDLINLPFWKCDQCLNFVGCHHKTKSPTNPLGNIPTPELRKARQYIHALLDPLWKNGIFTRNGIYDYLTERMGFKYHTAKLRTIDEARKAYKLLIELKKSCNNRKI